MRLARIPINGRAELALGLDGGWLVPVRRLRDDLPTAPLEFLALPREVRAVCQGAAEKLTADPDSTDQQEGAGQLFHTDRTMLLPPIDRTSKVVAIALNYRSHADEGGFVAPSRPVVFLKAPSSLCGHGEEVVVPALSNRIDHEAELAVVVGRRAKHLSRDDALDVVAGYTMMNDMTARDLQLEDIEHRHPWDLAKSIDTYGPTGPCLVTPDEVPDPQDLDLELRVDGVVRQRSTTGAMIFDVRQLLVFLSSVMTLEPGDIIATGTCDGIAAVPDGSTMELRVGDLGVLRNRVRFERVPANP